MQAYIDRNISVCLHFYGFRHTKNAPFAFMDKRAIENRVENAVFLQWLNQHTHTSPMPHTTPLKHPAPKESTLKRIMEFARLRIEGDFEEQSYAELSNMLEREKPFAQAFS